MIGRAQQDSGRDQTSELLTDAQWDLLADYLGGALDGDPQHDEVAALLDSDPDWRVAHTRLSDATDAVQADLRALADAPVGPMPDDVAARLEAALDVAEPRPLNVIPMRRRRWVLPATIAAGVLAFAAFGLTGLINSTDSSSDVATSAGGQAPEAAAMPMIAQRIEVSGLDYTAATVATTAGRVNALDSPLTASSNDAASSPLRDGAGVAPGLARLADPVALQACLRAIAVEHGIAASVVRLVDYASFDGSPGLVVLFTDAGQRDMVWVSGPQCGTAGMGADTRFHAPVG